MPKARVNRELNSPRKPTRIGDIALANRQQIEAEHKQLDVFLDDLRDTCCNLDNNADCGTCLNETHACCHGRLPSFIHDLREICEKHFEHEELLLLAKSQSAEPYEYYLAHKQAHAEIMQMLKSMQTECTSLNRQGLTAQGYRLLYRKVSSLFDEHNRLFDDRYIQPAATRIW